MSGPAGIEHIRYQYQIWSLILIIIIKNLDVDQRFSNDLSIEPISVRELARVVSETNELVIFYVLSTDRVIETYEKSE